MFIPTRIYGQKDARLMISGIPVSGFMDGTPFKLTFDGGEVEKTEGTDGAGLNIATKQGATFEFTLRETSDSYGVMLGLFANENNATGVFVTVLFISGSQIVFEMPHALIGQPGEWSTGDKKQGGITFKVVGDVITYTIPQALGV